MTATVYSVILAQSYSFNYFTFKEMIYSVTEFFNYDYKTVNNKHKYLKYFCYEVLQVHNETDAQLIMSKYKKNTMKKKKSFIQK